MTLGDGRTGFTGSDLTWVELHPGAMDQGANYDAYLHVRGVAKIGLCS